MINLIKQNKFEELKNSIQNSDSEYFIHNCLLEILNGRKIEIDEDVFDPKKLQEEFFEGFNIYKALESSEIGKDELQGYMNLLVYLAYQIGNVTKLMAETAREGGVHLSEIEVYKVHTDIRSKLQEFIELLKEKDDNNAIANVAAAKAQITTSIGNLLMKEDIGNDMLQFGNSYANIGQTEHAIQIYMGILMDFECESVKNRSGLFPEISQVDTRPTAEIEIFEKAKEQYEKLSGEKLPEVKRVHIDNDENAKKLVEEVYKKEQEIINDRENNEQGVWGKLKNLFKRN